ncbi:hypothetical protein SeMB42_g04834 [Synchytrium endobioticum]|uniref:Large ribosomal subunit protein uL4m n=1 Tax=Synchytrium endobioticum TaxID=286115 RepID=A0A507DHR3_9FUNG|nr:hypothetical protein SeMB42_g04834 [Synchytrium endobioticum]TPX50855.1 hypothetical protein SeLEV6574_g00657 [Synchytrium endobioticum]
MNCPGAVRRLAGVAASTSARREPACMQAAARTPCRPRYLTSVSPDAPLVNPDSSIIPPPATPSLPTSLPPLLSTEDIIPNAHFNPLTPIISYNCQKRELSELQKPPGLPLLNLNPMQAWIQSFASATRLGMIELDRSVFGVNPIRQDLIRRAVDYELSWLAQGTESSKTLGQVRGTTGKKLPQKGSGGARHGTFRANQMRGGYAAHGPRPHLKTIDIPTKVYHSGIRSALSAKYIQDQLLIVDTLSLPHSKTLKTDLQQRLAKLKLAGKSCFFLVGSDEPATYLIQAADMFETQRAGDKKKALMVANVRHVTVHPLMVNEFVIVDKAAVEVLEEMYHVD